MVYFPTANPVGLYSFASSAKSIHEFVIALGVSFMNITNNMGPNTEPCGIPLFALAQLENSPSTHTLCYRPVKNDINHFKNSPTMPIDSSVFRRIKRFCEVSIDDIYVKT